MGYFALGPATLCGVLGLLGALVLRSSSALVLVDTRVVELVALVCLGFLTKGQGPTKSDTRLDA